MGATTAPHPDAAAAGPELAAATATVSQRIARFAADLRPEDLPAEVVEAAQLLILDAVGVALASGTFDFAKRALAATIDLAGGRSGDSTVIGLPVRLPPRDAAHLNGVLIHGLDYDDTHPGGVVHATASALPTSLAASEAGGLPGRELLTGYVVGVEVATRLGIAANGAFHLVGFHPTGLLGAFGAAVAAARLRHLPASAIADAQGFVGSLAAGSMEFLATGAWTKRSHPGWAAACGLTAAAFAAQGFESPPEIYEGRFGLYDSHLGTTHHVDLAACTRGLGDRWEVLDVAVKPYPACHFVHAFVDAALTLREQHRLRVDDIAAVTTRIAPGEVATVCEPADAKRRPRSAYDAAFSLPYAVAVALVRGRFGLTELADEARVDPTVLAMVDRTRWEPDPDSGFPDVFSGEVVIETTDGQVLRHREQVNRGAGDRPLSAADIEAKYRANAHLAVDESRAQHIGEVLRSLHTLDDCRRLATVLGSQQGGR